MKLAYYIKKRSLMGDERIASVIEAVSVGDNEVYQVSDPDGLEAGTDVLLSFGGDGTFLTAARIAAPSGVPVLGVNFGRLGFLSEHNPEDVVKALTGGGFSIEEREILYVSLDGASPEGWCPYAFNEMTVTRFGAAMLGVDVVLGEETLPTYWADGLLVATSSGSTAYSLSVGGPVCTPDSKVLIVSPISPHNLNVRPLIVPDTTGIKISLRSRRENVILTMDNRTYTVPAGTTVSVGAAPMRLKRVCLGRTNFINALRTRLLWGEDVRNVIEK